MQNAHTYSQYTQCNILITPMTFGQIFYGLMRQKLNFLEVVCPVTCGIKTNTLFNKKNIIPAVKHGGGGGSVMVFRTWMTRHN